MPTPKEVAREIVKDNIIMHDDRTYCNRVNLCDECEQLISSIESAFRTVRDQALEDAAKIIRDDSEDEHCCEDCPCMYWHDEYADKILKLRQMKKEGL